MSINTSEGLVKGHNNAQKFFATTCILPSGSSSDFKFSSGTTLPELEIIGSYTGSGIVFGKPSYNIRDYINTFVFNAQFGGGRPDADGYLTLSEANDWYRNGGGQALNVDLNKINLSGIRAVDFPNGVGSKKSFNLLIHSSSVNDGLVYGSITLRLYENNTVRAFSDVYDFDMKSWGNPLNWPRNVETIIGSKYAGQGTPYTINFNGSAQIGVMGLDYRFK